jgi:large repetitive protein
MAEEGSSLRARRNVKRAFVVGMTGLAMLVVGPAVAAVAAEPEFKITQPATGSSTKQKPVLFKGSGVGPIVELYVSKGGSWGGAVWTGGVTSGKWERSQELPDGQYKALAVQRTTSEGEVTGSSETAFTVDSVKPTVTITPVAPRSSNKTPTLEGEAGVAEGDLSTVSVTISQKGSGVVRSATVQKSGSKWSWTVTPPLEGGEYTAQAAQRDVAGNEGKSTAIQFAVDAKAPIVTMSPVQSPSSNSKPTLTGSAGVAPGDKEPIVTIYRGTSAEGPIVVAEAAQRSPGGEWSFTPAAALEDGTYTAKAVQENGSGPEHAGGSNPITFKIDTRPPRVGITTPENGAILGLTTPTLSGAAGQEEGDLQSIRLKIYAGSAASGNPIQVLEVTPAGGSWTASAGPLPDGIYTAVAEQPDNAGNVGTSTITFGVFAPGNGLPPVASFQWIPSAPYVGQAVSLVSNSTDASSPITGSAWDLAGNGLFSPAGPVVTTSFSRAGPHVVRLRVTDASGLSSLVAKTIPVTVAPVRLVQPFPVVRIAGTQYRRGVRISLLSVQAPVGARIGVVCKGPGCPTKSKSQQRLSATHAASKNGGMALVEFRRFERALQAGAYLEIRVSLPGQIGKYTRFTVRRGKLPTRFDSCLDPTGVKPIACPTS